MVGPGKDFRLATQADYIRQTLELLSESNILSRVNLNIRGRFFISLKNGKMITFVVKFTEVNIGNKRFPAEYHLTFAGKDYPIKVIDGGIYYPIETIKELSKFLL